MITTAVVALSIWTGLATAACLAMHRARRALAATPPMPSDDSTWLDAWPERSPLDLEGYQLDARFYGVVAEAWQ